MDCLQTDTIMAKTAPHWRLGAPHYVDLIVKAPLACIQDKDTAEGGIQLIIPPQCLAGIASSIYRKPEMVWIPDSMMFLRLGGVYAETRNGFKHLKPPELVSSGGDALEPPNLRTGSGASRETFVYLKDVKIWCRLHPALRARSGERGEGFYIKHQMILKRRVRLKRCFRPPYFGKADCPAEVLLAREDAHYRPDPYVASMGTVTDRMVHHIDYDELTGQGHPRIADITMENGFVDYNAARPVRTKEGIWIYDDLKGAV